VRALILAAGFGTRLWPLTIGRTKPAIPLLNKPLISYTIEYLRRYGFDDLVINLHHEPDSVMDQIGDGSGYGVRITYSIEEPDILGTAGALDRVRDFFSESSFVVVNGKIVTAIDLQAALSTHRAANAMATLVLRPNPLGERFSEVEITPDGRISRFAGFPVPVLDTDHRSPTTGHQSPTPAPLMFTGIHVLEPSIFNYIPRRVFSDTVRDVYPEAIQAGEKIVAHVADESWYELSTVARYLAVSLEFLARDGRTWLAGEGCEIDATATIERSILWQGVRVGAGASLSGCVIGDGVTIPERSEFKSAAIVKADQQAILERPEKANPGTIIGENLVVPFRE
jgi:NDP-sugar pyrophosphorylase family protein